MIHVYEPLVTKNFGGEVLPAIATSWTISDDQIVYTFEILQGEKFHDGSDMTAEERPAYLDSIRITRVAEPGTRLAGLLAGDFDFVDDLSSDDLPLLERTDEIDYHILPAAPGWYTKFNAVEGPMANEMLSRAVHIAIDPDEVMAGFGDLRTWELNLCPRFHPSSPYFLDVITARYDPNDLELASALVEASGYAGEPIRFDASRDLTGWYLQANGMIP